MSELKAFDIVVAEEGYGEGIVKYRRAVYDKSEVDKMIAELREERRWRKFSDEKPKEKQWIFVFVENPSKYGTYIELRRWDKGCKFDVEDQELYALWMPLPSAPKESV